MNHVSVSNRDGLVAAAVVLAVVAGVAVILALPSGGTAATLTPEAPVAHDHDGSDDGRRAEAPEPDAPLPERGPADALVAETAVRAARWDDIRQAAADGYTTIGDGFTGYEHLVHWARAEDDTVLDPSRPESLVYRVHGDGSRTLVSVMYLLPPGRR